MNYSYLTQDRLAHESYELILKWQDESGAYVASPTFSQYGYAWLRDGAFCALAMHVSGCPQSAYKFNEWVGMTVLKYEDLFSQARSRLESGRRILAENAPPTRFHLDGSVEIDHHEVWPNYQLDGYGTWLAVLSQTQTDYSETLLKAVRIVADFLALAWTSPSYDCWEEGGDLVHGSTLLAVAGGLKAATVIVGDQTYIGEFKKILNVLERDFVIDGHFVKHRGDPRVDASLAWASLPHHTYDSTHPLVIGTVDAIKRELKNPTGGVKRYIGDTYYGGGDWVLLEGLLAWNEARCGNREFWEKSRISMHSIADDNYLLPEQVLNSVQDPNMVKPWEEKWGTSAHPLLWSHAMYLLMLHEGAKQEWI